MHALLVTFHSTASLGEGDDFVALAGPVAAHPGLRCKAWLAAGERLGRFVVLEDEAGADAYLASEMIAGLGEHPAFSDVEAARFDVDERLSALTGLAGGARV